MTKDGEVTTYGYDESFVTSETLSGTSNQSLNDAYNNGFNPSRFTCADGSKNRDEGHPSILVKN